MILHKYINNAYKEIKDILKSVENEEKDIVILESYENLNQTILNIIKTKDTYHIKTFFDLVTEKLNLHMKEFKKVSIDDIEDIFKTNFKITENRKYLQYVINLICEHEDVFEDKKNNKLIEEKIEDEDAYNEDNEDNEDTEEEEEDLNIPIDEVINNFKWRDNQKKAIENTIKQNFKSGVHDQIMGAGKSYIILNLIWKHYQLNKNNLVYPIVCYRQEILKDLFFDKNNIIDKKKKKFWKDNDIIDLDKFNIIDCVNYKQKHIKVNSKKPNILVINTTFLSSIEKENNNEDSDTYALDYDDINLVILDECHGISAPELYKIFHKIKYDHEKSIIGFSATVLRDKAEAKVVDIFSRSNNIDDNNKKLNIISRYDFMDAIRDNVILPPHITIMEVKKTIKEKIGRQNKDTMFSVINNLLNKDYVPYKKVLCLARTINQMKDYYKFFTEKFGNKFKIFCSSCDDKKMENERFDINGKKYNYDTDYKKFSEAENYAIMICVNRYREGSDIYHLDTIIYLDRVKKRSTLVRMQTSGRVLRVDVENKKSHGYIIDTFINDDKEKVEILTANLILYYYNKILQLSEDTVENKKNLDNYKILIDTIEEKTKYDEKTRELTVRLDDNNKNKNMKIKLELTTKTIDWKYLKTILISNIDKIYDISKEEKFNQIVSKLKKLNMFNINSDFWEVYNNLDEKIKIKYGLLDNFHEEYKEFFDKYTWYELLELDTSNFYKTVIECRNAIIKLLPDILIDENNYRKLIKKDKKIPMCPEEYYKNKNFIDIITSFNIVKNSTKMKFL